MESEAPELLYLQVTLLPAVWLPVCLSFYLSSTLEKTCHLLHASAVQHRQPNSQSGSQSKSQWAWLLKYTWLRVIEVSLFERACFFLLFFFRIRHAHFPTSSQKKYYSNLAT